MRNDPVLLRAIRDPGILLSLDAPQWNVLLRQARQTRLLGRLGALICNEGQIDRVPKVAAECLDWARRFALAQERAVRWEVHKLERALADIETPIVLLKGAAYVMAELPAARGRLYDDVDILVPKARIVEVERALLENGWEHEKLEPYDQRYYRKWMHELPPLRHRERGTSLDVHHTILPETGRLHPKAEELFRAAVPLAGSGRLAVLCPADMVLHSAAHLFQDGEVSGSLRDLVDLDDLLGVFGRQPGFRDALAERSRVHGLERPMFYALRYTSKYLGTATDEVTGAAPSKFTLDVMDSLVGKALLPQEGDLPSAASRAAGRALYVRSHWLRMPAHLLIPHLLRKSIRGLLPAKDENAELPAPDRR